MQRVRCEYVVGTVMQAWKRNYITNLTALNHYLIIHETGFRGLNNRNRRAQGNSDLSFTDCRQNVISVLVHTVHVLQSYTSRVGVKSRSVHNVIVVVFSVQDL